MKKLTVFFIIAMVFVLITGMVYAECCSCCCAGDAAKAVDTSTAGIINTTCPVMGGEVKADTPHVAMYNDKKIGFCCTGCVAAFEKDPEKYINNIDV